ncbi:cytochrome P450 [Nocardioidaceae bacterium SCSIO 66511]|nr:cytochrome P450 [Nocardioidaceae bacterium SCSIO 66511]
MTTTELNAPSLPPGPPLPWFVQTIALMRARTRFVPAMHRRYGDLFTLRVPPSGRALVFVNRPEHIKEVFAGDPKVFHAGEGNAILGPVMGEHSVLLTDEDVHLRARKLLMPAFNGAALRSYEGLVATLAKREVDSWESGQTLVSLDRMNALTLEIIMQVVFGVTDEHRLAELRPLVNRTVNIGPLILLGWAYPKLQQRRPWSSYLDNQVALNEVLYAEIAQRRKASDLHERSDVLSRLLLVGADDDADHEALSDAELRDQLVTLLLAGHETTASALSWTIHELAMNPDVQHRARTAADDGDLKYLEAVLKEGMRVHPIIDQVARMLTEDTTVAGHRLPAGTTVSPSIRLAHLRDQNHLDPHRFRPERFIDGDVAPNTWLPFGGGVRRCIGAGFSLMEGTAVLREILQRYELSMNERKPERTRIRNITCVPKGKARVVVTAR